MHSIKPNWTWVSTVMVMVCPTRLKSLPSQQRPVAVELLTLVRKDEKQHHKEEGGRMLFLLLCAYAITFGIQHKVSFLHNKSQFTDKLLACTYCTGFHSGYITYLIDKAGLWLQDGKLELNFCELVLFAFASSMFSYMIDTLVRLMEKYAE